jgi:cation transport ATPase
VPRGGRGSGRATHACGAAGALRFERALWFSAFFYVLFSVVLIGLTQATREKQPSVALAVVLGVASNILTSLLVFFATRLRRSRSRQEQ